MINNLHQHPYIGSLVAKNVLTTAKNVFGVAYHGLSKSKYGLTKKRQDGEVRRQSGRVQVTGERDVYIPRKAQNIFSRRDSTINQKIDMFFNELLYSLTGDKRQEAEILQLIDGVCAGWIEFGDYIESVLQDKIEGAFQEKADEEQVAQQESRAARTERKRKKIAAARKNKK